MNISLLQKTIIALLLALALLSCRDNLKLDTNNFNMSGKIREPFVKRLTKLNRPKATITLSSSGGLPNYAMQTVDSLKANQNSLIIFGECFSACAEYLLPVAKTVGFQDNPLVGFHWNAMMSEYLMRKKAEKDVEFCTFSDSEDLSKLQYDAGVNNEFWLKTFDKLGRYKYKIEYRANECPLRSMRFQNQMWLPTSNQLRELYQLEFTGPVCADDYEACKKKIDRRWKQGKRLMVGDIIYISKGQIKQKYLRGRRF